jgi:PleD family two-component response regulator
VRPHRRLDDAARRAEPVRLRTTAMQIRQRQTHDGLPAVSVSGDVAALQPGDDAAILIGRADAALCGSKQAGRDRVSRGCGRRPSSAAWRWCC